MAINKDMVLKSGLALGTTITAVNGAPLTDGKILIGNTATGTMSLANITGSLGAIVTNGNGTIAISTNGASANTFSALVARDSAGSFVATSITAALIGNASTATSAATLTTARTINGVSFDGSANISFNSDAVSEGSTNLYFTTGRASAAAPVQTVFGRSGAVVLTSSDVTTALTFTPENPANKNVANGYAGLDASGKVLLANLPASVTGGLSYQGVWNASTNSPTLVNGTGTKGFYYKVSTAGNTTIDGNSNWTAGDMIIFNGTTWDKAEGGSPDVISVAGRVGAITLANTDISGLGTMSTQAASAVAITGGTISGVTITGNISGTASNVTGTVAVANGGTGAITLTGYVKGAGTSVMTASATIPNTDITGLGTISTQAASSVAITGGTVNGTSIGATTPSTGVFTSSTATTTNYGAIGQTAVASTAVSTTTATAVDSWATSSFRAVKYIAMIVDSTASTYEMLEMLMIHDGATVYTTTYGDLFTGAASLGSFDATISTGTLTVTFTAVAATTKTVKVIRTAIA